MYDFKLLRMTLFTSRYARSANNLGIRISLFPYFDSPSIHIRHTSNMAASWWFWPQLHNVTRIS